MVKCLYDICFVLAVLYYCCVTPFQYFSMNEMRKYKLIFRLELTFLVKQTILYLFKISANKNSVEGLCSKI